MRYEELTIEGRNAVLEAFRSGKTIDKLYVLDGWNGVVTLAVVSGAIALAIRLLENARIVAAERRAS